MKKRVDILLTEKGLCESREKAQRLILAGKVRIGSDRMIMKSSEKFPEDTEFNIAQPVQYVSRGAYKLLPALDKYLPDLSGLVAADIGASTGGFTDLMLQRGAEKVYCIDSGRGQLHGKLRNNPRVLCFEKTNARYLPEDFFKEKLDVMTMDVSFISVTLLLGRLSHFFKDGAIAFVLIKPQFEAERGEVGKGGVVRDSQIHDKVIDKVVTYAESECSMKVLEVIPSPIKGPKGNQEFIAVFKYIVL
jgi:23S rRNA (cytidine1920-2'-O)/16S rRNA (cytidine1409-2'-O)-methyltransferase